MSLGPSGGRNRPVVLIVDDEPSTVRAVQGLFRRQYRVLGATSGQGALDILAQQDVWVALCDQRMPGMSGHELLAAIRDHHPKTVRVLITAYADLDALIRAVNDGQIFAYLGKPWTTDTLEDVVERAVAYRQMAESNREMTTALREANARLQRMNGELRDFAYAVAHDVREPLRTITAYSQLLRNDHASELSEEATGFIDRIGKCADYLDALTRDLLSVAELEQVTSDKGPVEISEVAVRARQLLEGALQATGGEIVVEDGLGGVVGHRDRLTLLLQNLVSNGLKFNQSETPTVTIGPASAMSGWTAFTVADNGIGIPAEQRERVFKMFARLHSRNEYPGTGAGLAIVKKIVDAHGGRIQIESEVGSGTTFTVRLPAA